MSEQFYKRLAREYAERQGQQLRAEANGLEADTSSLDMRVNGKIQKLHRKRYPALIAACIALALLSPLIARLFVNESADPTPPLVAAPSDFESPPEYQVIPLGFTLPDHFSISAVEQDVAKTVYYINAANTEVVLTLEAADDTSFFDELTRAEIGDEDAYIKRGGGYCLLTFEKNGVLFTMTSQSDMSPLYELCKRAL